LSLQNSYLEHIEKYNKGYFDGQLEEGQDCCSTTGEPLTLTAEERADNEDELIQICHKLWLDGECEGFDYAAIDNDEQWDDNQIIERDSEDKYFESEEPETTLQEG
jgi:hypothetical protein